MSDEITLAQNVLREFGYDVQENCRTAADALIGVGLLGEAARIIDASQNLLTLLREVSGKDFLLTDADTD